jgi:hypothetical protein
LYAPCRDLRNFNQHSETIFILGWSIGAVVAILFVLDALGLECSARTDMHYFGAEGDRMQMMFNVQVNQNLFYGAPRSASRASTTSHRRCCEGARYNNLRL